MALRRKAGLGNKTAIFSWIGQKKLKPVNGQVFLSTNYFARLLNFLAKADFLRAAVFLWRTPLVTLLSIREVT